MPIIFKKGKDMIEIHQYEKGGLNLPSDFMNNFAPYGFISVEFAGDKIEVYNWRTSEHYYQAHKFPIASDEFLKILNASNTMEAFNSGHKNPRTRADWNLVKNNIMLTGLYLKFTQNKDIMEKLIATREETIVEISDADDYWGVGKDGTGKNWLGLSLMNLREIFKNLPPVRNEPQLSADFTPSV